MSAGVALAAGIEAAAVRRTFGNVIAVADISLSVPRGHVTALVGPNGAGKTTLMLVLATLLKPDAGRIRVAGYDPVTDSVDVRARTGWMPDAFGTYDTLTAREVLEFAAAAYRVPRKRRSRRAWELLALVHLDEFAERPVHALSRGQQQRLGLARALVNEPTVLLLDEPAAGLDPRSRIELRGLLRGLAAQGCAVLVSSHVLAELETIADRVVFIDRGRSIAEQALAELQRAERRPWRIRALDSDPLMVFLDHHGTEHGPPDAHGVEVLLSGDEDAAELLSAMVRDRVPVVSFAPAGSDLEAAYLAITEDRQ
ncbi:MAG TPA: ABC transporter ATP-binding protein [Jiangellaceae bacterium]|nr:ABC transporter ATP-binding protein [Jiangellaceae bacterium]